MKFIVSWVVMFVLLDLTLGTRAAENILTDRISNCVFIETSKEAVELICDNFNETKSDAGNCYSWFFKSNSKNEHRLNVKHLKTRQCPSRELGRSLSKLFPNVIELDISNFGLETMNDIEKFDFKWLRKLNASHNKLRAIYDYILSIELTEIDFSHNSIEMVSASTFEWAYTLTTIDLSANSIIYIQDSSFNRLKDLRFVNLSNNLLEIFDMRLFRYNENVVEIHFENNRIKRPFFDKNLSSISFKSLTVASFAMNEINYVHEVFSKHSYPALQMLNLSKNPLMSFDVDVFHDSKSLKHINLSCSTLQYVDFNVFRHPEHLVSLDLNENRLMNINFTSNFGHFSNLEFLNVEGNFLKHLDGATVLNFPKLSKIGISRNQLTCEYAKEFLQQWPNSKVIGDPCEQLGLDGGNGSHSEYNFFLRLGLSFVGATACAVIVTIFIIRRKSSPESHKRPESNTNNYNKEHIYEEPIYEEINPSAVKYDHLDFVTPTPMKFDSHYHNASLSKPES